MLSTGIFRAGLFSCRAFGYAVAMTRDGQKTGAGQSRQAEDRRKRLAAELRANLKRRKVQAKARRADVVADPADEAKEENPAGDGVR